MMINQMKGTTVLITGSTDGIGKQTALGLARMGLHVLIHGRNSEKGRSVLDEIRQRTGNDHLEFFQADLSSQREIRSLASQIKEEHDHLDVLINNAGVFMKEFRRTEDGIEMTFAVNHLSHFLLTHLLLDLMIGRPSRIITVSSVSHFQAAVDLDNLKGEKGFDSYQAYAFSKLANILFTYELARRLFGSGITANCLHPGEIDTKMLRSGWGDFKGDPLDKGAETPIYLATSPEVSGISGDYFEDMRPSESSRLSRDKALQKKLWEMSEQLCGMTGGAGLCGTA